MAENIRRVEKAGVAMAQYWNIDSNGICIGTERTAIAAGAQSALGRLKGIKTASFPIPEAPTVPVTGDDTLLYEFIFPPTSSPKGQLQAGTEDLDFEAQAQNTLVYAEGGWDMGVAFPGDMIFKNHGLHIVSRAASDDDDETIQEGWWNRLIPLTTIAPQGEEGVSEQSAISTNYQMVINRANRLPFGRPFGLGTHGTTRAGYVKFWTEYLWTMEIFQGHGTPIDTLELVRTPIGDHTTNKIRVYLWESDTQMFTLKTPTTDWTYDPGDNAIDLETGDELPVTDTMIVALEYDGAP